MINFHCIIESTGKRRIFNYRDISLFGNFSDTEGKMVNSLGDAFRRFHFPHFILKCNGKVRRVRYHHIRVRNRLDHPLLMAFHPHFSNPSFDLRISI